MPVSFFIEYLCTYAALFCEWRPFVRPSCVALQCEHGRVWLHPHYSDVTCGHCPWQLSEIVVQAGTWATPRSNKGMSPNWDKREQKVVITLDLVSLTPHSPPYRSIGPCRTQETILNTMLANLRHERRQIESSDIECLVEREEAKEVSPEGTRFRNTYSQKQNIQAPAGMAYILQNVFTSPRDPTSVSTKCFVTTPRISWIKSFPEQTIHAKVNRKKPSAAQRLRWKLKTSCSWLGTAIVGQYACMLGKLFTRLQSQTITMSSSHTRFRRLISYMMKNALRIMEACKPPVVDWRRSVSIAPN